MTTTTLIPLTPRQRDVWRWIRDHHSRHRIGCNVRAVMAAFEFSSPNGAYTHLKALRRKGWVEWTAHANSIIPTLDSLEVCDDA